MRKFIAGAGGLAIVGVLVVVLGATGFGMAYFADTNDNATREIGGALVSGAVIGGAILAYEELAEARRQRRADEREDRYEHNAAERSANQIVREDRLSLWRMFDEVLIESLSPDLFSLQLIAYGATEPVPKAILRGANSRLNSIRVECATSLIPIADRLADPSLTESLGEVVSHAQQVTGVILIDEFTEKITALTQAITALNEEVSEKRIAERSGLSKLAHG